MAGSEGQYEEAWTARQVSLGPPQRLPPQIGRETVANLVDNEQTIPASALGSTPVADDEHQRDFTALAALPASDAPKTLEGRYVLTFELGFSRSDVYRELTKPLAPLGIDTSRVQMALQQSWVDGAPAHELSIGCVREARFVDEGPGSATMSELVALEQDKLVGWDQLQSTSKRIRLVGLGPTCPSLFIALDDTPTGGARVTMTYTFHRVQTPGCCGMQSHAQMPKRIAQQMNSSLHRKWDADMRARSGMLPEPAGLGGGFEVSPSATHSTLFPAAPPPRRGHQQPL